MFFNMKKKMRSWKFLYRLRKDKYSNNWRKNHQLIFSPHFSNWELICLFIQSSYLFSRKPLSLTSSASSQWRRRSRSSPSVSCYTEEVTWGTHGTSWTSSSSWPGKQVFFPTFFGFIFIFFITRMKCFTNAIWYVSSSNIYRIKSRIGSKRRLLSMS